MGGCTSKPKTSEYEGLMDPQAQRHDQLGRNSIDTETKGVEAAQHSLDAGLKTIDRNNSSQKDSARSLQTLFVKQQESGDEGLVDNTTSTVRDILLESGDSKQQTSLDYSSETNLTKAEKGIKPAVVVQDEVPVDGGEAIKPEAEGAPVVKEGQEDAATEVALAATSQETSADNPSSSLEEETVKERALRAETEPEDKNGPPQELPDELVAVPVSELPEGSVVNSETPLSSTEPQVPAQEPAELVVEDKPSDQGVEVVKPVDGEQVNEETSVSDSLKASQSAGVTEVVEAIHPQGDSDSTVVYNDGEQDATKETPSEDVSEAAPATEVAQVEEKVELSEEASLAKSSAVDGTVGQEETEKAANEEVKSVGIDENPVEVPAEDTAQAIATDDQSAEVTPIGSHDSAVAPTVSSPAVHAEDKADQSSVVQAEAELMPERSAIAEESIVEEEVAQIAPESQPPTESPTTDVTEGAESTVQDDKTREAEPSVTEDKGMADEESVVELSSSSSKPAEEAKSSSELGQTEEQQGSEKAIAPKEDEAHVEEKPELPSSEPPITNHTDSEPTPSDVPESSTDPPQGDQTISPELSGSEAVASTEAIISGKVEDQQDHLTSTSDPAEVPQGLQMNVGQVNGSKQEHQGSFQSQEGPVVASPSDNVLLPEMESGEGVENKISTERFPSKDRPRKDIVSSDMDQVWEKLASEFERQASVENGS